MLGLWKRVIFYSILCFCSFLLQDRAERKLDNKVMGKQVSVANRKNMPVTFKGFCMRLRMQVR